MKAIIKPLVTLLFFTLLGVVVLCGTSNASDEKNAYSEVKYEEKKESFSEKDSCDVIPCSSQVLGVKSISVESLPYKTVYKAFERFSGDGLTVSVHYENGTNERIGPEKLEILYSSGDTFLAGDTSVTLSYGGRRTTVDVTVKKADYDMSGVSFVSSEYVYDGETHYPKIKGRMPEGEDGIALEYSFRSGVCHVDEGTVDVTVSFSTKSKNYNVPSNMRASVKIIPRGINVIWGETEIEYTGLTVCPEVYAKETELEVHSEAINVGRYYAVAVSKNNDYYVIDNRCEFTVTQAKNFWESPPEATECYEGKTPELSAKPRFGNVEFTFYSDFGCKKRVTPPFGIGTYYAVASVSETANYSSLSSAPFAFRVVEILPTGLSVRILSEDLVAYGKLSEDDYEISLLYNDGSESPIDKSSVEIIYENGDSLRQKDRRVKFLWDKYEKDVEISVNYADYDLSNVKWIGVEQIYDGNPKCPALTGLPEGVTVSEYIGGGATNAGKYTVSALIEYDSENYNRPDILDSDFVICKQKLKTPVIKSEYNSEPQSPIAGSDAYRVVGNDAYRDVGEYSVKIELTDPKNYELDNNNSEPGFAIFKIEPRTVKVELEKVRLHLFEKIRRVSYKGLSEGILDGDSVDTELRIEGDRAVLVSLNPNYRIDSIGGEISRLPYPTVLGGILLLAMASVLVFAVYVVLKRREELKNIVAILRCRWHNREMVIYPPRPFKKRNTVQASESTPPDNNDNREEAIPEENNNGTDAYAEDISVVGFGVEAERADLLITDSLAKDLIKKNGDVIYTDGISKATVTTEELNDNFTAGDRIDINVLKEKKIVSADAFQIKIVASGMLDKALKVYANDFTLTAVKMINLEGGETVKVTSLRDKSATEDDGKTEL